MNNNSDNTNINIQPSQKQSQESVQGAQQTQLELIKLSQPIIADTENDKQLNEKYYNEQNDNLVNYTEVKLSFPRSIGYMAIFLSILGLTLLAIGFYLYKTKSATKGLPFWIIGAICICPGLFYLFRIVQLCLTKDKEHKIQILHQIPRYGDD